MQFIKRGNSWSYRFEIASGQGARRRFERGGYATKREAEIAGNKAFIEYNHAGEVFVPSEMSVEDYFKIWIDRYCRHNLLDNTTNGYVKRIKNLINPAIGKYKLSTIKPYLLQGLINDLFNRGYARNTLTAVKGILNTSMKYAVSTLGYLTINPAANLMIPSPRAKHDVPTRKKKRVCVTEEHKKQILERFPEGHPAHIPLMLAMHCGLRLGEVFALMWSDIDLQDGTLTVNHQVQNLTDNLWELLPPKYDSIRKINLDDNLLNLLRRTFERQQRMLYAHGDTYVRLYANSNNQIVTKPPGTEIFMVNVRDDGSYIQPRIMQHVGRIVHYELNILDFDFHSLRHTHGTDIYNSGVDLLAIKDRLGHKKADTTETYVHVTDALRLRSIDTINELYGDHGD